MLFLRSLIDFPSNLHRICIEFASALQRRIIGGILENFAYNKENLLTIKFIYQLTTLSR